MLAALPPPDEQQVSAADLRAAWPFLSVDERLEGFVLLLPDEAVSFFLDLSSHEQALLLLSMHEGQRIFWIRLLAPDDAADLLQEVEDPEKRQELFALLDEPMRKEVTALLAYEEDEAGGLMNPRFARVRPDITVDEAITYLRRQSRNLETIYYAYVLDPNQRILGVVSFRDLITSPAGKLVSDVMRADVVTLPETLNQEEVARIFRQKGFLALPVVDEENRVKGIVTSDDVVEVVEEEATEDMQKMGGMAALDTPYLRTPFFELIRKRGGWLAVLFLGEMLTATAMGYYEDEIARAVVLALFVPLIISSGGNAGSQATTLVIRAMALGELRVRDWWRVVHREFGSGFLLGLILATIGFLRILVWEWLFPGIYGEHYLLVAIAVAVSLVGVVTWGTLSGSMLPFLLRRLGFDPASASAPFVATLVDVSGLVIYFTVASYVLAGTLL